MMRCLLILALGSSFLFGQFTKEGTTAAQFLKLGIGARAMGMGAAYVALSDDGTAHYWNPAGLAGFSTVGAAFMRHDYVLDIKNDFVSLTIPAGNVGVFGVALTLLSMDEKEITTVEQPSGTGQYYRVQDLALGLSYARQVSDRLRYGLTAKYISLKAHNELAQTVAVDIGSVLKTGFYGLSIGMALSNFGGNIRYDGSDLISKVDIDDDLEGNVLADARLATESWPLPMIIRIGIASDVIGPGTALVGSSFQRLTFALDAIHPNDAPERVHLGAEYALWEAAFLRMGYRFNYDLEELSFGAGLRLPIPGLSLARIDFAVTPMQLFGNVARISIEVRF
ncbi:MAG: PorV/PorQ family protein [Fidelibacterota bacterium]|nr:MAG: PorV/PorQ family protein [Candidatus Neomarinimicrobiota bacterium]